MTTNKFLSILFCFTLTIGLAQDGMTKTKKDIMASVEKHKAELIKMSDEIWALAETAFQEQPFRPDHRLGQQVPMLIERDRLFGGHLDIHFKVILKIRAHTRPVRHHIDAVFRQMRGGSNPRQHQDFGRIDR